MLAAASAAPAAETELDLSAEQRVYAAEGSQCRAVPTASGTGLRLEYDFTAAGADWVSVQLTVPAIDHPVTEITITARGTPNRATFGLRDAGTNKGTAWPLGTLNEEAAQTFHIPVDASATPIVYPVTKVFFQLKVTGQKSGWLEIEKAVLTTEE